MDQVRLRPVENDDIAKVASFLAHADLVGRRGLDHDRPVARSVSALTTALESLVDPKDGDAWVIETGEIVGLARVDWWWDALTPWANVVIDTEHQQKGHGTAAARLVMDHLFLSTPAILVQYDAPGWDEPALSFANSLGGEEVGRQRRVGIRDGAYFDSVQFAMPRSRWEEDHAARR